jgi:hypothetical protein
MTVILGGLSILGKSFFWRAFGQSTDAAPWWPSFALWATQVWALAHVPETVDDCSPCESSKLETRCAFHRVWPIGLQSSPQERDQLWSGNVCMRKSRRMAAGSELVGWASHFQTPRRMSEGFWLLSFSVYFHFKSSDSLQKKLSGVTTMTTSLQRKTRFHTDVPSSWLEPHIDQADFDLHQATWSRITHASAPVRKQGNGKRLLDCFKRSWNICRQILLGRGDLWWVMNDLWWFMILWWFYSCAKKHIVSFLQLES